MFKPIRAFKPPALDLVGPIPHPALQSMFDALYPPGHLWYWKADFVKELSDEAIARHVEHGSRLPTMQSTMHLYPIDGAAAQVKNSATAWAYRDARLAEVIVGVDPDPANKEKISTWARDYWTALHPYSTSRRLRELHDGRGRGPRQGELRENYDAAHEDQEEVRPGEPVPGEPEHQARDVTGVRVGERTRGLQARGSSNPRAIGLRRRPT